MFKWLKKSFEYQLSTAWQKIQEAKKRKQNLANYKLRDLKNSSNSKYNFKLSKLQNYRNKTKKSKWFF